MELNAIYLVRKLKKSQNIYIFGAGNRGLCVLEILKDLGIEVAAFIDNDKQKRGQSIQGVGVVGLKEMPVKEGALVIISPFKREGISDQLEAFGISDWVDSDELFYYIPAVGDQSDFCNAVPFNHYESPYADIKMIRKNEKRFFDKKQTVLDIDFNQERQLELLEYMKKIQTVHWTKSKSSCYRYYYDNEMFGKGAADVLCYMMQIIKPRRIIEVGSGFSTAVMLDTNNTYFNNSVEISCIEPRAERLKSVLLEEDRIAIYEKDVQEIGLDFFDKLEPDDFLFIDSSHVARPGGDVNFIFFEILPRLRSGVYIHFHDVFWPFVYPKAWIYDGRAYNEMYVLRAFLMNNPNYSIQFFGEMIKKAYAESTVMGIEEIDGSIWIKKD